MLQQRLKGAIDRTIAEEQARQESARQKTLSPDSGTPRRSDSTSRSAQSPARRPRPKKTASDAKDGGDSPSNPDPAVFEAAFVIDDNEEPSRAGTPKPAADKMEDKPEEKAKDKADEGQNGDNGKEGEETKGAAGAPPPPPAAASELSPEVRTKLRKLEKLEKTYPGGYSPRGVTPVAC